MDRAPGGLVALRRQNRERVLGTVRERGSASRADVARATGLSRSAVSNLVGELLAEGLLVERPDLPHGAATPAGGRPAVPLTVNPAAGGVLGAHFGHDSVRVVLADLAGALLGERVRAVDVDRDGGGALDFVVHAARDLTQAHAVPLARVVGLGVALSAPVPRGDAALPQWAALPGRSVQQIGCDLQDRLGVPVDVGNDADLGALAEWRTGAGRGVDDLVYVMLSDGVGAGLVLAGNLYQGADGTAGELGHVVVDPDGRVCRCGGRGCLETVVAGPALVAALQPRLGADATVDDVVRLAASGDAQARQVVARAGRALGAAVTTVCTLLAPRRVVVGGKVAACGELLLAGVREVLDAQRAPRPYGPLDVVAGALDARAEVMGAVALAGARARTSLLKPVA